MDQAGSCRGNMHSTLVTLVIDDQWRPIHWLLRNAPTCQLVVAILGQGDRASRAVCDRSMGGAAYTAMIKHQQTYPATHDAGARG
jgi:hypothetical protein